MKKLFVLLSLVVVAVLAITPKLVGLMIRDESTETKLMEMTGQPGLSLTMESGWFSSLGQITIRDPVIAGNLYQGVVLIADLDVMHGPLLVTDDGVDIGIAWARLLPVISGLAANDPIQQLLAEDMQTSFTGLVGLDGSLQLRMEAGALQFAEAGSYLYLDDLQADLRIAANGNAELRGNSSEVTFGDALNDTVIRNANLTVHTDELSATPLPGGLSLQATQVQINGVQQLTMNGISIDYVARPEADTSTITLQQSMQIDEIVSTMPIDSLTLTSELTGIDENIAADYIAFISQTQGRIQSMTETELQATVAERSEQLALDLIRSSLQLQSDATVQAYGGEHSAQVDIEWPGLAGLSSLDDIDVRQVLRTIGASLNIVADEEAMSRSPIAASIRAYVVQGMLPQENGNVLLNASLQNSVLIVNEQRIALEAFLTN